MLKGVSCFFLGGFVGGSFNLALANFGRFFFVILGFTGITLLGLLRNMLFFLGFWLRQILISRHSFWSFEKASSKS